MNIILESDILNAYINNEINEYDILDLYSEGYISDNTMELLISEDEYISEAASEVYNETEALEEGKISRAIRAIGHNIAQAGRNYALKFNDSRMSAHISKGNLDKAVKYAKKGDELERRIKDKKIEYLKRQAADARLSKHTDDYEKFKSRLDRAKKQD